MNRQRGSRKIYKKRYINKRFKTSANRLQKYKAPVYMGLGAPPSVCVALKAWGAWSFTTPNGGATRGNKLLANGLNSINSIDGNMAVNGHEPYFAMYNRAIVYGC